MWLRSALAPLALAAGCGVGSPGPGTSASGSARASDASGPDRTSAAPSPTSSATAPAPPCPAPTVAKLSSYLDVRIPDTYWIEMVHTDRGWEPAERLPMPHHHATRLELTNLADFPRFTTGTPDRVRFVIEVTARDIQHDPDRATWFTTYQARILDGCPLPGA